MQNKTKQTELQSINYFSRNGIELYFPAIVFKIGEIAVCAQPLSDRHVCGSEISCFEFCAARIIAADFHCVTLIIFRFLTVGVIKNVRDPIP